MPAEQRVKRLRPEYDTHTPTQELLAHARQQADGDRKSVV